MRILHLLYESEGDTFGIGGVGIRAYEIYHCLKERHDITLLCKKYPGAADREIRGLKHIFVGSESRSLTVTLLSYTYQAAHYVKQHGHNYDLIIEEFSPATPMFLSSYRTTPLILQVQGYTGRLYFSKYNPVTASVLYGFEHMRPRSYSNFIFINSQTIQRLALDMPEHMNYTIIPNGVETSLLDCPYTEGNYILYLGRIDILGKGIDTLLAAFADHAGRNSSARLVIAGDGRDMPALRELLCGIEKSILARIELTGWVSGSRKKELLQNASFAVFPSRHEVQPIAVLEAMAAGKPVITTDIPEFSFITKAGAGISFSSGDAESLSKAIGKMISPDFRKQMGPNGRAWVKDLGWDRIAKKFEAFLEATVAQQPSK